MCATARDAPPDAIRPFSVLAVRPYRYLLGSTFLTSAGLWAQQMGQGWLVYQLTGSALQLGVVAACQGAAILIVAPLGGVLADRFDRRKLVMLSQTVIVLLASALAALVALGLIRVWHLYVAGFSSEAAFAIYGPARQALINDTAGRGFLPRAIGLHSFMQNVTRVLGPAAGGAALATAGVAGVYILQAGLTLGALIMSKMIRVIGTPERGPERSFIGGVASGFGYVRSQPVLRALLLLTLATAILGWPWQQLMPAYAREVLGLREQGFGLVVFLIGLGAMTGAVLVVLGLVRLHGTLLLGAMGTTAVLLMMLGLSGSLVVVAATLFLLGVSGALTLATIQTLLQLHTRDEYRGRVLSLYLVLFGLEPLGALPAGAIAQTAGVQWGIFVMGGLLIIVTTFTVVASKQVRGLDRPILPRR